MRYFICANDDEISKLTTQKIRDHLQNFPDFIYDKKKPEIVISVGGDGRVLKTINQFLDLLNSVAFVGISTGKLGFLCDYKHEELMDFLNDFTSKTPRFDSRRLIESKYNGVSKYFINEFRLETSFDTVSLDLSINDVLFERFKGNGVYISSSTGSTAYNKSLGGPLVPPFINALILGKIAPINNLLSKSIESPILFGDRDQITIKGDVNKCAVGGDYFHELIEGKVDIEIKLSEKKVNFAHYRHFNFIEKIKKFL